MLEEYLYGFILGIIRRLNMVVHIGLDKMKIKLFIYMQNMGDGSVAARFFKTAESADNYASYDNERMCDDIDHVTLEFDDAGNLLTPEPEIEWMIEEKERRDAKEAKRYR